MSADVWRRLGRGVIVNAGAAAPDGWGDAARVRIDDDVLRDPTEVVAHLHARWAERAPVVVEVAVDVADLRAPEVDTRPPCELQPSFEFEREHLYFLARSNNYDGRGEGLAWGPSVEARRLGARAGGSADILLSDGTEAWVDGGPRHGAPPGVEGAVVHRVRIEHGDLTPDVDAVVDADLAPDQLRAVTHPGGPARVIAPAGSGKTRVLTERFRLLVARRGWGAAPVCAVAYNVRAKREMEQRLADVDAAARRKIRTLHALGFDALRRAREVREVLSEWDVRRRIEPLVPVRPRANTDVYAPYLEALGEVRLGLVRPEVVEARRDDVEGFATMFGEYRDRIRADGVVDHDEQIYGAIEVLCTDVAVRRALQSECRHLLVDEFQDLTPAQLLMLRLLAAPAYDVFGVGDDDQVIYGYAGADPAFLIDYDRFFPGATHLALEVNYRCPSPIVAAARNVLAYNRIRVPKQIRARDPERAAPDALTTSRHASERLPAAALEQVQRWLADGAQPGEIAVLTRVRSVLLGVQVMSADAGIPANAPIGSDVLDRTGARAALAYLRLTVASPDALPGPDLAFAARRPSRSLRREVLQRIASRKRWTRGALRGLAENVNGRLDEFLDDLAQLEHAARAGADTEAVLRIARDDIGLGGALDTLDRGGRGPEASHRDDLNALISVAELAPDPVAFEPWLRAHLDRPRIDPADGEVTLSTVHRVKGMEWPYVVVLGVHDGLMPHHLADDTEEERRVFHVALTRAASATHLIADATAPTRFFAELDGSAPTEAAPAPVARQRRPAEVVVGAADERVFEALKAWRRDRARADGVPAYVVLHDTHLQGIAARGPATLAELSRCSGIGPTKLERYGDEIVAVIADLAR